MRDAYSDNADRQIGESSPKVPVPLPWNTEDQVPASYTGRPKPRGSEAVDPIFGDAEIEAKVNMSMPTDEKVRKLNSTNQALDSLECAAQVYKKTFTLQEAKMLATSFGARDPVDAEVMFLTIGSEFDREAMPSLLRIINERVEQVTKHGFTLDNDYDLYRDTNRLLEAAKAYITWARYFDGHETRSDECSWPFEPKWFKPHDKLTATIKAAALLAAYADVLIKDERFKRAKAVKAQHAEKASVDAFAKEARDHCFHVFEHETVKLVRHIKSGAEEAIMLYYIDNNESNDKAWHWRGSAFIYYDEALKAVCGHLHTDYLKRQELFAQHR